MSQLPDEIVHSVEADDLLADLVVAFEIVGASRQKKPPGSGDFEIPPLDLIQLGRSRRSRAGCGSTQDLHSSPGGPLQPRPQGHPIERSGQRPAQGSRRGRSGGRAGNGGIRQVEVDAALIESTDHRLLRQPSGWPAGSPGVHLYARVLDGLDDLAPVAVRLADEAHVVLQREGELSVEEAVAGPLTLDDVVN